MDFFKKWGEGIKNLSPKRQLESKVVGIIGSIIGIIFGGLWLVFVKGQWYFSIVLVFMAFLQGIELIAAKQQLTIMKRIESGVKNYEGREK